MKKICLLLLAGINIGGMGVSSGAFAGSQLSVLPTCIDDHNIMVGGNDQNSCRNLLPKCSALLTKLKTEVAQDLALIIHGFLRGWKIDLKETSAKKLVKEDLPIKPCSVVGQKLKAPTLAERIQLVARSANAANASASFKDLPFNYRMWPDSVYLRTNGGKNIKGDPCGGGNVAVLEDVRKNNRQVFFNMIDENWIGVSSAVYGVYPWAMRRAFYDFFEGLKITDLDSRLSDLSLVDSKSKYVAAKSRSFDYFKKLPEVSKAACTDSQANLLDRCMERNGAKEFAQDDPGRRVCQFAKIGLILGEGSPQKMITYQILANAMKLFQDNIQTYFKKPDSAPWSAVTKAATSSTTWDDCDTYTFWSGGQRVCAARTVSGIMGDGRYQNYESSWNHTVNYVPDSDYPSGELYIGLTLDNQPTGLEATGDDGESWDDPRLRPVFKENATEASGWRAVLEWIIRNKLCAQTDRFKKSPRCDDDLIPSTITKLGQDEITWKDQ